MSEGSNIRVVVRCRGRNQQEISVNSRVVVDTLQSKRDVAVNIGPPDSNSFKTYTVDQVFGPDADQIMMFEQVVSPVVDDFISGLNCTVFAYGQTGTGKTYTMSGDVTSLYESCAYEAGMIPRVLFKLFEGLAGTDCAISVSFIELYNEELKDLLTLDDDASNAFSSSSSKKLRLVDNPRKGTVQLEGISECHIRSALDGLELLRAGMKKRHVGATRMNDVSSRSHAVFTINAAISREDGTIVRTKMNLVDLAGSESIGKSGAEHKRAREAGIINQSLLTLGRVINSLVDKSPHIPYRESKLTRLLQDSLGGETKTCIIATISPASVNSEETLSTLEYASRAKSIRNKPQINTYLRKTLLSEFNDDLAKMRLDLAASRKKNGIYMDEQNYNDLIAESDSHKILISEQQRRIDTMERQLKAAREAADERQLELSKSHRQVRDAEEKNHELEYKLSKLSDSLVKCQERLDRAVDDLTEEKNLREAHAVTETSLHKVGHQLISSIEEASQHIGDLHDVIQRTASKQASVKEKVNETTDEIQRNLAHLEQKMNEFAAQQDQSADSLLSKVLSLGSSQSEKLRHTTSFLSDSLTSLDTFMDELLQTTSASNLSAEDMQRRVDEVKQQITSSFREKLNKFRSVSDTMTNQLEADIREYQRQYSNASQYIAESQELARVYGNQVSHISLKLQAAVSSLNNIKEQAALDREDQERKLQNTMAQERNSAIFERKKLLNAVSGLFEQYASAADERLVTSLKDSIFENSPLDNIQTGTDHVAQGLSTAISENEEFHGAISLKLDSLNKLATDTSSSAPRLNQVLAEFKEKCQSFVDAETSGVEDSVQALDAYFLESGEYNLQRNTVIAEGIANMCNKVRVSFTSLGDHLTQLQNGLEELKSPEKSQDLVQQITKTWTAVSEMIFGSTSAMMQSLLKTRHAVGDEELPRVHAPKRPRIEYEQLVLPKTEKTRPVMHVKLDEARSTTSISATSQASTISTAGPRTSDVSMEDEGTQIHGEENIPEQLFFESQKASFKRPASTLVSAVPKLSQLPVFQGQPRDISQRKRNTFGSRSGQYSRQHPSTNNSGSMWRK